MDRARQGAFALRSSFRARARLVGSLPGVAARLSTVPALRPVGKGSALRYEVLEHGGPPPNKFLELGRDYVALEFEFGRPSAAGQSNALAVFLSVLSFLAGQYEVAFSDLYPDIMAALQLHGAPPDDQGHSPSTECLKARIAALSEVNYLLSRRVVSYASEKRALAEELSVAKSFCDEVVLSVSGSGTTAEYAVARLCALGVSEYAAKRAVALVTPGSSNG